MELAELGYFSKTHGIKGQLVLKYSGNFSDGLSVLFVEVNGGKAPYFISEMKEAGSNLVVGLEDIDTVEKARPLVGKKVLVDPQFIVEDEEKHDWLAYELIDKRHGMLGRIKDVMDNGAQLLVTIDFKGKEVMLPLVEDFIEKIDEEGKKLYFNAPEGLVEMYLEENEEN